MTELRQYTTQLGAGLGMVQETLDLLRLWQPGESSSKLSEKVIAEGIFSRTTARRAHNIVAEMFAPRFLANEGRGATYLKPLTENNRCFDDLVQLFFLYTARAQAVFYDFIIQVYWPRYSAGGTHINKTEAENFIHRALDNGHMKKRWSPAMIDRVAGYLLGCCIDFGLLADTGRADRPIKAFSIRPNVVLYLVHELHFAGHSDLAITRHPDFQLFGFEPGEVPNQIKNLSHDGHLIIQAVPDLVQIAWKYSSMEDCIRAITQR